MEKYFILTNSEETLTKRFIVQHSGYNPVKEKSGAVKKTVEGELDVSVGGIYIRHEYLVRVRAEEEDSNYGTKDDLDTFFSYNNPNPPPGEPSNILTMTDHFGNQFLVTMVTDFAPVAMGILLEGTHSLFIVKVVFLFLSTVESIS